MSLCGFELQLGNPHATYYAGQQLTGWVIVRLAKEKKIRGIAIQFKGEAKVRWNERDGNHEKTRSACELYFYDSTYLIGDSRGEMKLPAGENIYPFRFLLPKDIPSSFEGSHGFVRYTVKAKLDRPWKFDHECKTAFTVLTHLDLNNEHNIQRPVQMTKEKYLCCLCCMEGPISIVVNLPFQGFVPGQKIPAVIELDNMSSETVFVKNSLLKCVSYTVYHTDHVHTKFEITQVAQQWEEVHSNHSRTFTTNLTVPSVPSSYQLHCRAIAINYVFLTKVQFSGTHSSMHLRIPLIIGTIPLRFQFRAIAASSPEPDMPPSFSEAVEASPHSSPGTNQDILAAYPEMPPPSYEECMLGRRNIRTEDDSSYVLGPMDFAPRYPHYSFPATG